jgi:outer membrane lipoprotein SlyB
MYPQIILGLLAIAVLSPLPFSVGQVYAQSAYVMAETARIDGFDVEPVVKPAPGNELAFTVYGSPGGHAAVQISGATGGVVLTEIEAGVYEGIYTIRARDKVTVDSIATVNLRVGNKIASAVLDEPLVGRADARRSIAKETRAAIVPRIDRFDVVTPPASLVAGEELILTLAGSPGGAASARIVGVRGKVLLHEVRSGVYEGTYTIKQRDRIEANSAVTATLRLGERDVNAVLRQSLLAGPASAGPSSSRTRSGPRYCLDCGVVEAVNVVEVKGQGTYLGKIAGGVAGILVGSQVGRGSGKTVAQVAGAAGGAYAGNEIEKHMKTTKHYEVVVRLENGGTKTVSYAEKPDFAIGTKVKLENDTLRVIQ